MRIDHTKSFSLEIISRRALGIGGRSELGGVISADFIEKKGNAFTVLVASLVPYYLEGTPEEKNEIGNLIQEYIYLTDEITDEEYSQAIDKIKDSLTKFLDSRKVK